MRRAAKRDDNEAEIARALVAAGWVVTPLSGAGLPDLMCMRAGTVAFIEVKQRNGAMSPAQVDLHEAWERAGVRVAVVCDPAWAIQNAAFAAMGDWGSMNTYRDWPWEGVSARDKAKRLALKPG